MSEEGNLITVEKIESIRRILFKEPLETDGDYKALGELVEDESDEDNYFVTNDLNRHVGE